MSVRTLQGLGRWKYVVVAVVLAAAAAIIFRDAAASAGPPGPWSPPPGLARFAVFRTPAAPGSVASARVATVAQQRGVDTRSVRQTGVTGDGTTLWMAGGATEICLLAEQPTGVVQDACQPVADAAAGNLWFQRDDGPGNGQVFGVVPDGSHVSHTAAAGGVAAVADLPSNNTYETDLHSPSAISIATSAGTTKVITIKELP